MIAPDTSSLTMSAEQALKETEAAIAQYETQLRQLRAFRTACQQVIQNRPRVKAEDAPEGDVLRLAMKAADDSEAA